MANTDFIQATIEIFGAVITFVVAMMFSVITGNEKKSEKDLFFLLIGSGLSLIMDAGWYIHDGNTALYAVILNRVFNLATFMINPLLVILLVRFVCNITREKDARPNQALRISAVSLALIALSMPLTNLIFNWMYYFDSDNIYHRLFGWYVYTVINCLSMVVCMSLVFRHRNLISKTRRIALYVFWLAPFAGIAFQSVFIGISFIQLGTAIGSICIIASYLIEWIGSENRKYDISDDRKKIWIIECVFFIMILFISSAIVSCVVSVNNVSNKSSEQNSIALTYMVSETIESTFSEPINVSKTMAQSDSIINALKKDDIQNTQTEAEMLDFMKRVKEKYGYQMIFVASEKTKAYYTYDGFSRTMDDSKGANDYWYQEFKDSGAEYELNLDADKDNNMSLAAFVNMEVRDEDGEYLGACGVAMSIESLMEILSDYENSYSLGISLTDRNGLVQVNPEREKIENERYDVTDVSLSGKDVSYKRNATNAVMKKYMENIGWYLVIEDNSPNKLNVIKIILPSVVIYLLGVIIMFVFSIVFGIHERHRSKELRVSKIESEVANAASEAKGRFLANMSHEIRTPINAVLGMDTMILRESSESQIKEYAMSIRNAGNTLLSLINDILDISKIESGKMEIVPVEYDFSTLIYDVMNMISIKADAKGLDVNLIIDQKLPSVLFGDDIRIRQIIVNLMNNAVKYTEKGSITLIVNGTIDSDTVKLRICVKDTGIGIKEEDLNKLYEDYVRIEESRNKNIEGTGLGMSISIRLLELMNSRLDVSSVYGEGSEFSFELEQVIINDDPVGDINLRLKQKAAGFEYEAMFTAPEAKVLVVDDNPVNRVVFTGLLKETEVMIDEAGSGIEALKLVSDNHYDIIFLDHMMPDMDGIEVMQKIKSDGSHPNVNTPVIALTANAISGAKEEYLAAGFNDYLSKPIIPEHLEKMLYTLLPEEKLIQGTKKPVAENTQDNVLTEDFILPQIEGIDWDYAKLHIENNDMLMDTARRFRESIRPEADILENAYNEIIATGDDEVLAQFRIKVHSMKSTATLLGCVPVAGMAATLEYAARDKNIGLISDMTPHFLKKWREYYDKFSFTQTEDNDKKEIEDVSVIREYLIKLKDAVQVFDVHGADSYLDTLKEYSYEDDAKAILDKISVAVNNLDIDETVTQCDEMISLF